MNETDYIIQKLVRLGWEDNGSGLGDGLFSPDARFIANISYIPHFDWYEVRVALTGIFDGWVNSSVTRVFKDKGIVLDFFRSKAYMVTAYKEALRILEEDISNNPSAVEFMNKIIDMSVDWFHEV